MAEFNYNEINKRAMAPNLLKSYGVDIEKAIQAGSTTGTETTNKETSGEALKKEDVEKGGVGSGKKKFNVGDRVVHSKFGPGSVYGHDQNGRVYVRHDSGIKFYHGDSDLNKEENKKVEKAETEKKAITTGSTTVKETELKDGKIIKGEDHKAKVKKVMDEWKAGTLKTGSGEKVTDQKQAIAIALHQAGLSKAEATGKDLDELIEEHKNLINVLESPSHEDDKKEAKEQKNELKQYKEEVKKAFDSLGIDIINK